jgi:hypothetical protein
VAQAQRQYNASDDVVLESAAARKQHVRHEPDKTVLYEVVLGWLETFLCYAREAYTRPLPRYVERELRRYLDCGILACGFARGFCKACGASIVVALSCKCRGSCPSCSARRMCQTAANLVDLVLPDQPIRQWTVSLPFELRLAVARNSSLLSAVLRIVVSEIDNLYKRFGQERGVRDGATGIVSATQYFGGAMNLNPHFHLLAADGVFSTNQEATAAVFTPTRAPATSELRDLAQRVHERVVRMMRRRGLLRDEGDDEVTEPQPLDACAQLSLRLGKLGHVDERGVVQEPDPDEVRFGQRGRSPWSGEYDGWNIHAGVTVKQGDADSRERLCRYVLRHPLSLQRLAWTKDGRLSYEVKYPRSPKQTHLLLDPVQFLARLASLIPPPRHPLVRYFGVLSSASKWRPYVVPPVPAHRKRACGCAPSHGPKPSTLLLSGAQACFDGAPAQEPEAAAAQDPASQRRSRGCVQAATRCKMGARRLPQLALRGFRAPPSEPGVHLSLCTGLSADVEAKYGGFSSAIQNGRTRVRAISNGSTLPSFHRICRVPGLRQT